MQTRLPSALLQTRQGQEADAILRRCVHCGFCTATCPTYQLFNDELDGPRGRIYLIKQLLEQDKASRVTQQHLDLCLQCRACETTCPSGVEYSRLLDIGKQMLHKRVSRSALQRMQRWCLVTLLPRRTVFGALLWFARRVSYLLPTGMRRQLAHSQARSRKTVWPRSDHPRKVLLLQGCVQPGLAPNIDAALGRVLDRCGISLIREHQVYCCGALEHHLEYSQRALQRAKANIDLCWPHIEAGIEAIVMTASGCALMLKEYAYLLQDDDDYRDKARRFVEKLTDPALILAKQDLSLLESRALSKSLKKVIAYHAPCTQQHGLGIQNTVQSLLMDVGFRLVPASDAHLCCGSAGAYALLNARVAASLRERKLFHLQRYNPDIIATANIGCMSHLAAGTTTPVRHWIELLDVDDMDG